ncbi:hypothetical protein [Natrinema ejinorense]|uniref:hypothetical protein n=1 Tax=Natrinema ejinorense TaxID=373386 RepID=UPI0014748AE0|nr:hypothetical protein [Natrinema ejinorense]
MSPLVLLEVGGVAPLERRLPLFEVVPDGDPEIAVALLEQQGISIDWAVATCS